jgi:hypothetical protein
MERIRMHKYIAKTIDAPQQIKMRSDADFSPPPISVIAGNGLASWKFQLIA